VALRRAAVIRGGLRLAGARIVLAIIGWQEKFA
jgi:hypothetical protein